MQENSYDKIFEDLTKTAVADSDLEEIFDLLSFLDGAVAEEEKPLRMPYSSQPTFDTARWLD